LVRKIESAVSETHYLWEMADCKIRKYNAGSLIQYTLCVYDPAGHLGEAAIQYFFG
jgi:hypothetical protein